MNKKSPHLWAAVFFLFAVPLAFSSVLGARFVNLDDPVYVLSNPKIAGLSLAHLKAMFLHAHQGQYGPLVLLSYAVERHFFGLNPSVFHGTNLLLHAVNAALVCLLFARICGTPFAAFLTAALFAFHPTRVDAFALVTSRKDVLYAMFYLASILQYLRWREEEKRSAYFGSLAFFALSLLSKPMAVTLPLVLVLFDTRRPCGGRVHWKDLAPFAALAALFAGVTLAVHPAVIREAAAPLGTRVLWVAYAPLFYLEKIFFPVKLAGFYPRPDLLPGGAPWLFVLSPFILAALLAAAAWAWKIRSRAGFGLLFFLVTLIPVLPFYLFMPAVVADRYAYIPALGIFYAAAEAVAGAAGKLRGPAPAAATLAALLASVPLIHASQAHARTYRDSFSFWEDAAAKYPSLAFAHAKRADALIDERGDAAGAMREYDFALSLDPKFARAYTNRGVLKHRLGDDAGALADLDRAIMLKPRESAAAYNGRGVLSAARGDLRAAAADFQKALDLDPGFRLARENLSKANSDMSQVINNK